jgi:hypothetical protein
VKKLKAEKTPKKPISDKTLQSLLEKAGEDKEFLELLKKDVNQALASRGYYITESFQKKLSEKARSKAMKGLKKEEPKETRRLRSVKRGERIRINVKIDPATGQKEFQF